MHLKALVIVLSVNLLGGLIGLNHIFGALSETGLGELFPMLTFTYCAILVMMLLSGVAAYIYTLKRNNDAYFLFMVIDIVGCSICCFSGTRMMFDTKSFIQGAGSKWEGLLNTNELAFVEQQFRCCGFVSVNEFSKDKCSSSKDIPCFTRLFSNLKGDVRRGGSIFILHGASFVVMLICTNLHHYSSRPDEKLPKLEVVSTV